MTDIILRPRETRVFQNEQLVRLKPNANAAIPPFLDSAPGILSEFLLSPKTETLRQTNVNLVNNMGAYANALPVVSDAAANQGLYTGEQIADGAYALRGGAVPTVPTKLAVIFRQVAVSEHTITIAGLDELSAAAGEAFSIEVHGVGPHITADVYKQVDSVTGSGTIGAGATDLVYIGPAIDDALWAVVGQSGRNQFGPAGDWNDNSNDGDASYAECTDTVDRDCFVGLPHPPRLLSIESLTIAWATKQIGAGAGVELRCRFASNPGTSYLLESHSATGTESGTTEFGTYTFSLVGGGPVNPATGNRMTVAEWEDLEIGVRFLGESPTIEKRWQFIRVELNARQNPQLPGVDLSDPAYGHDHWKAVAQDPFTAPDDTQYCEESSESQTNGPFFELEDLPAEAIAVNSVAARLRVTMINSGHPNGTGGNDFPCALGTPPLAQPALSYTLLEGPLSQANLGGMILRISDFPGAVDGPRFAIDIGDPSGGCGTFFDFEGDNVGYGNFVEHEIIRTLNSSGNPIAVDDANQMEIGVLTADSRSRAPVRISRAYAEVEFLRRPNGSSSIFHFAIDDDLAAPDDTNYMESQHSANKKFGVDFPSIPEVSSIQNVRVRMRARKGAQAVNGWRLVMRQGNDAGTDVAGAIQHNTSFDTIDFDFNTSPFNPGVPWSRAEVNNLVVIWEAIGENAFNPKQLSAIGVTVTAELIPEKIDAARDIASRKLRLLRRPRPFLTVQLPIWFLDAGVLGDVSVIHNALPRTEKMLGFERWDRSLMRVFKEVIDLNRDLVTLTLLDLREFLNTLWITGRTRGKGVSAEGMAILTPGVTLSFKRATNDYFEDPFAGLIQELAADEAPQGIEGILIQGNTINRVVNSAFAEGATDTFDNWTKTIQGTGGSIVEDLADLAFDQNDPNPPKRSVLLTASDNPPTNEVYLLGQPVIEHGDGLTPQGARYAITVEHKDDDSQPLSVAMSVDPPGFSERFYDWRDEGWNSAGGLVWQDLPVRTTRKRDQLVGNLRNMEDLPGISSADPELTLKLHIGVRSAINQRNHLYTAQVEGGATANLDDRNYPSSFVLTRTGQVVRNGLQFYVPNFRTRPSYPAELRGTCFLQFIPEWDSATLPAHAGARRYIYSLQVDADNYDRVFYDADAEKFVFERRVAATSLTTELYYPQISKGIPIAIATRWVSSIGDLGEPPFSFTIFVEGEQGTTAVHSQKFPLPSESKLWLGSKDGEERYMLDGTIRNLNIVQFALPLARIRRLP